MSVAPGWYKDPADPTTQRWWDGEGWVGAALPADATPPPGPPAPGGGGGVAPEPHVPAVPGMPAATETVRVTQVPPDPAGPDPAPRRAPDPAKTPPPAWSSRQLRPTGVPSLPADYILATPVTRLLARLVDTGLVFGLNVLVNGWFAYQFWVQVSPALTEAWRRGLAGDPSTDGIPPVGDQAGNLLLVIVIIAAALWFAYEVPAVANSGQTPGKRLLGIRVARLESREPLNFSRSFRRWNTMGFPTLLWYCFGIGLVIQLVDALFVPLDRSLHQALHDRSAHTVVVTVAGGEEPPPTPHEEAPDEPAHPS